MARHIEDDIAGSMIRPCSTAPAKKGALLHTRSVQINSETSGELADLAHAASP